MTPKKLYGFFCPRCFIHSGGAVWAESALDAQDYSPGCCGDVLMAPYEIPLASQPREPARELGAKKEKQTWL